MSSLDLDKFLDDIDLTEWLDAEGISWRSAASNNLNIQECPFCNDRRFKVFIHRVSKKGICFHGGCPKTNFNLFSFAREHYGEGTASTINRLKRFNRTALRSPRHAEVVEVPEADGWELPESTPIPMENGATLKYLTDRRVLPETQKLFGMRWCDRGFWTWNDPVRGACKTDFSKRVILPVLDLDGTLQSFQGRTVLKSDPQRYLFPASLPGGGRFLYGGHLAMGFEDLVLGEGPFDTIGIHQSVRSSSDFDGYAAIGSFGLSISHSDMDGNDQMGRLRQLQAGGAKRLTIMWDGSRAAYIKALEAGMAVRKRLGMDVFVAAIQEGYDPSDLSTEAVRRTITARQSLNEMSFVMMQASNPYTQKKSDE